jgi:purine-binding chemotaxis protein CheW
MMKSSAQRWVTLEIDQQVFGLPVEKVQDVLYVPPMTPVPLSSAAIAGLLNLRGRIITAIDMGVFLGKSPIANLPKSMCVVLEEAGELYSFIVNKVGEVLTLPLDEMESNPPNLGNTWGEISSGIYQLDNKLLVAIDPKRLFTELFKNIS